MPKGRLKCAQKRLFMYRRRCGKDFGKEKGDAQTDTE